MRLLHIFYHVSLKHKFLNTCFNLEHQMIKLRDSDGVQILCIPSQFTTFTITINPSASKAWLIRTFIHTQLQTL
jgi:hypothetical protein